MSSWRWLPLLVTLFSAAATHGALHVYPIMPDCTSLQPAQCTIIPTKDADGEWDYLAPYQENCTRHECAVPAPRSVAYTYNDPATPSAPAVTVTPWFCSKYITLDYSARVVTGTGLPPGKAEDLWAECNYAAMQYNLLLEDCRDMRLWTCADCREAYREWLCTAAFQRCGGSDPSGSIVRPCDDTCWAVVRKCPASQQFSCPNNGEMGDYIKGTGMPTCNDPRISSTRAVSGITTSVDGSDGVPIPGGIINPESPIFAVGSIGNGTEMPSTIQESLLAGTPIFTANGSTATGPYNGSQLAGPVPAPQASMTPGLDTEPISSTGSSVAPAQALAPETALVPSPGARTAAEGIPPPPASVSGPSQAGAASSTVAPTTSDTITSTWNFAPLTLSHNGMPIMSQTAEQAATVLSVIAQQQGLAPAPASN